MKTANIFFPKINFEVMIKRIFFLVLENILLEYHHKMSLHGNSCLFYRGSTKISLIISKGFPVDFK